MKWVHTFAVVSSRLRSSLDLDAEPGEAVRELDRRVFALPNEVAFYAVVMDGGSRTHRELQAALARISPGLAGRWERYVERGLPTADREDAALVRAIAALRDAEIARLCSRFGLGQYGADLFLRTLRVATEFLIATKAQLILASVVVGGFRGERRDWRVAHSSRYSKTTRHMGRFQ